MSPPGSMFTRSRTPATGLKTGRSTARCVAACRLNTLPGYVPACSRPKPRTRPESSPRMPGTRCGSDSTPCRRWPSGVRQGTPAGVYALFPEELSTTRASSRAPGETRRSSQKGLIYPGNQAWKCKQPVTSRLSPRLTPSVRRPWPRAGPRHASIRTRAASGFLRRGLRPGLLRRWRSGDWRGHRAF